MSDPFDELTSRVRMRGDRLAIRFLPNGDVRVATKDGAVKLHWDEAKPARTLRQALINAGLVDDDPEAPLEADDDLGGLLG
jgi:hypothetical protein